MLAIYNEGQRMFWITESKEDRKNHNHKRVTFIRNNFKFDMFLSPEVVEEVKVNLEKIKKTHIGIVFSSGVRMSFHNKTSEAIAVGSKEPGAMLMASLELAADEKIVDVKIPKGVSILTRKFTKYSHLTFVASFKPGIEKQIEVVRYHKDTKELKVTTLSYNGEGGFFVNTVPMEENYKWREKYDNFRITTFKPFKPFHLIFAHRRTISKCKELYGNKNYTIVEYVNIKDLYLKISEWEEKGFIAASIFSNVQAVRDVEDAVAPLEGTERELFSKFLYAVVKKFDKSSVVYNDGYVKITTDHKKLNRRHITLMKEREDKKSKAKEYPVKKKVDPVIQPTPLVAKLEDTKVAPVMGVTTNSESTTVVKPVFSLTVGDSNNIYTSSNLPSLDEIASAGLSESLANHFNSGRTGKKRENPKKKKR